MSEKNIKFNKNVLNTVDNMNNLMVYLYELDLIYYYTEVYPQMIDYQQIITWNNHISDRANCGSSFITLKQYQHILKTRAFHCILYDGSIIRASFVFKGKDLINHSHLWWPAPYKNNNNLSEGDLTPLENLEDFITNPEWMEVVRMRSPIRIDFDPNSERESHPLVHMHTQNHETRIHVDKPMCFSGFLKYILLNFYPQIELDYSKWNLLNFSYSEEKISEHPFSRVII